MKPLRIEYNGKVLFDGEVRSLQWTDSDDEIKVVGRLTDKPDLLSALRQVRPRPPTTLQQAVQEENQ